MSKLFMCGTRLQEFEQMMLVPNFTNRGKGLIVLKGFPFSEEDVAFRFCTEYPKCKNDENKCLVLSERLKDLLMRKPFEQSFMLYSLPSMEQRY